MNTHTQSYKSYDTVILPSTFSLRRVNLPMSTTQHKNSDYHILNLVTPCLRSVVTPPPRERTLIYPGTRDYIGKKGTRGSGLVETRPTKD